MNVGEIKKGPGFEGSRTTEKKGKKNSSRQHGQKEAPVSLLSPTKRRMKEIKNGELGH